MTYPKTPGHRKTDTSKDAAKEIRPSAQTIREKAFRAIKKRKRGLTSYELADRLGMPYMSVQPRTSELQAQGYIVDSGTRRLNPTGKMGIVWVANG